MKRRTFIKNAGGAAVMLPLTSINSLGSAGSRSIFRKNALLGMDAEVKISPEEGWSDKRSDYTITIKLGKDGLSKSDSLGIVHGSFLERWQFTFPSHFWKMKKPWQSTNPMDDNYLSVSCNMCCL